MANVGGADHQVMNDGLITDAGAHGASAQTFMDVIANGGSDMGMGDLTKNTMSIQKQTTLMDLDKSVFDLGKNVVAKRGKDIAG